jgi:parallel beta-helix repeat protein
MKKITIFASILILLILVSAKGQAPKTWTVDDDKIECPTADFTHPQDAVNAANPGDIIMVYPGTYYERVYTTPKPPHWGPSDQYAPPLIVYKDDLIIEAVDSDPSNTVIACHPEYNFWVNKYISGGGGGGSIEHSTGGIWNPTTKTWDDDPALPGDCVRPKFGSAPNAVVIIANNVTIRGFTIKRPYDWTSGTYNTAGVMVGGLYAGYGGAGETLGFGGNTVENCVFEDVWHAVYIWHSSGNKILNNKIEALNTDHWAAISTYDGYNDAQIGLGSLSENNIIAFNIIENKGIALGAWAPPTWTSNAGSVVCCNTATWVGVTYSHGPVIIGGNTGGFWTYYVDKVIKINGVTYTGDTELYTWTDVDANLSAQLDYTSILHDGSGIEVIFNVNETDYLATTTAGGYAQTTANLPPGNYTVTTKINLYDNCRYTDSDNLVIGQFVIIDIKPGSYPNSINLKSKGNVPVAVLTTLDFNARTVNPSTVSFAGASPRRCSFEDVDKDGDVDMMFHFDTEMLELTQSSTSATLTANTYDGISIKGTDSVKIVH